MANEVGTPCEPGPSFADVQHDYGDRWQITREMLGGRVVLTAMRHPTVTSQEVHVAFTVAELAAKLAEADSRGSG